MTLTSAYRLVVLVYLLLCQSVRIASSDDSVTTTGSDAELEESMYTLMDSILEDLTQKYETIKTDDFWHPYDFGTGNDNREVINVVEILEHNIPGKFIQWKNAKLGLKQQLVGLTSSSIQTYDSKLKQIVTKDMPFTLKTMEVFTKWDADDLTPFMVIMVATSTPSILMLTLSGEDQLQEIGSFPLPTAAKSVTLCSVENSEKIMLVPENSAHPITIYNIESTRDEAQLWFFQRITEPGFESAIVHNPDTVDSMLLVSRDSHLNIYQFDSSLGHFSVKQNLPLQQTCSDMLSFTMMYQHYVSCKDTLEQVQFISYNFNMNEYEDSTLEHMKASEIFPVGIGGSRGDLIFVSKTANEAPLNALIYDGKTGFKTSNIGCTSEKCTKLSTLTNGARFDFEDTSALILPSYADEETATILEFVTEVFATPSPVLLQSESLFEKFTELSKGMHRWRAVVTNADNILKKQLNVNGDNVITGNWQVRTLTADDVDVEAREGRAATSDNIFNQLKVGKVHWTEEDFASTSVQFAEKMSTMESSLTLIESALQDALYKQHSGLQIVKSQVTMGGQLLVKEVEANNLNVKTIWERDATEFFQSLASKEDQTLQISGGLTFSELLSAQHIETKKMNTLLVNDMALLNGDNVFQCPTTFESMHALGDITVEKVNGRILADSVVMADDVKGFTFADGIMAYKSAEITERLPFDDILLSSVPQTVVSPVIFDSISVQAPMFVDKLNDKPFTEFNSKIIKKGHQGVIRGTKKFTDTFAVTTLFIKESWNGLKFPEDFFTPSDTLVLNGEKSFHDIVANTVAVAGEVDGINTDDLVSLTEAQVMDNSVWKFNGGTRILNNINVANRVDGVPMETLIHQGLLDSSSLTFNPNADIVFKQPVHIEDLRVSSTINDKTFEEIFGNLMLFDGTECQVPGTTTINGEATFNDLHLHDNKINDFSVENFLTRDTDQIITKPVTFTESVFFEELQAHEDIDSVRVNDVLEKAMRVSEKRKSDGKMVPWDIHFESIACQSSFTVNGPINDLAAYGSKVAVTKGIDSQVIDGPVEMNSPVFSLIEPQTLQLSPGRTLQTMDVPMWSQTRATLSDPLTFAHPISASRISVLGDLQTSNINGVDVDDLRSKVFRRNGMSQHFNGPISLEKLSVHNGDLQFHQAVDNFILDDLIAHGFPLKAGNDAPLMINNGWQFMSMEVTRAIEINGNVCGVDLHALQVDSVQRNEKNVEIFGDKSFAQNLEITDSLRSPQVNGKQLDNAFLLREDQEVEGHMTFASHVFKDVLTVNSINNVDLTWLKERYSFENGQHVLDHDTFIDEHLKTDSLRVLGKMQGHNLEEFLTNTVKLSDENMEFTEEVEMISPIKVQDKITADKYNDIDVTHLSREVVRLDETVTLKNPISFTDTIKAENVIVNGDLQALSLTNGIEWNDLMENSIKLEDAAGTNINFKNARFHDLVTGRSITARHLNGRPFQDFVTLNTEQNLGTLKIGKVLLESANVDIQGNFGSHDLSEEFEDTLMSNKEEPQRLPGSTRINGGVHIKENISCFGSNLQKDVVTTRDPFALGPVEFTSPIAIENDILLPTPLFQGHSLDSILSGTFNTGGTSEQVISDKWEFLGPVTFRQDVTGKGVGDKVDIQAFVDKKNADLKRAEDKVEAERERFLRKCKSLSRLSSKIAKNPVKLDSFDAHQVIALKNEGTNVLTVEGTKTTMLFVQTANCRLERYEWLPSTELFHKIVEVSPQNIGNVDNWQSVPLKEGGSIIVFSKSMSSCSKEQGLFSVQVAPNGDLSQISTIRENFPVKSFKVARKPDTGEIKLFNLVGNGKPEVEGFDLIQKEEPGVEVFKWNGDRFSFQETVKLDGPMDRVDVTASSRGFGLMCHNENSVLMYDISNDHSNDVTAEGPMLASKTGSMAVFENFETLYALLPESGTATSSITQPTCNFQVMRLNGNSIESVQKLQVPEVTSSAMLSFSNKNFVSFLSKSHGLSVHKFMGLNGFQQVGKPYKVFGGFMLKSFDVKRTGFERPHPFLLVLSKNSVEIFRGNVFGDAFTSNFGQLCNT